MRLIFLMLVVWVVVVTSGCASPQHQRVQALLQQQMAQLPNDQLLRGYYDLSREAVELGATEAEFKGMSNQYGTHARIDRAFGARASANDNAGNAIATLIFAGIANAQRQAVVTKALEARVELELRGWTPVLGFTRSPPRTEPTVQYVERAGALPDYRAQGITQQAVDTLPQVAQRKEASVPRAAPSMSGLEASRFEPENVSPPAARSSDPVCHQMVLGLDGRLRCGQ